MRTHAVTENSCGPAPDCGPLDGAGGLV